jgi:hypothetical protein
MSFGGRVFGGESPYKMAGFSGGGGHMQKSCKIRTSLSNPPSIVMISRIRGDVQVCEMRKRVEQWQSRCGIQSYKEKIVRNRIKSENIQGNRKRTSSIVQLRRYANTSSVLRWERKVGLAHCGRRVCPITDQTKSSRRPSKE